MRRKIVLALLVAVVALLALFSPIDSEHYTLEEHYYEDLMSVSKMPGLVPDSDTLALEVGWGRAPIVPSYPAPMAGYKLRKAHQSVHDTLYAHVLVMRQGHRKAAIAVLDLLIFPSAVRERFAESLSASAWKIDEFYLGASHTHNGIGGWMEGLANRFMTGEYDPQVVEKCAQALYLALDEAEMRLRPAEIYEFKTQHATWVTNRVNALSPIDDLHSGFLFKNDLGKACIVGSYTAHPTNIPSGSLELGNDYPYYWRRSLEQSGDTTAIFMAGAVGSHASKSDMEKGWARAQSIGEGLAKATRKALQRHAYIGKGPISIASMPLAFDDLQIRLLDDYGTQPWLFEHVMGRQEQRLSRLQIGRTLLFGLPCDFSGELALPLYEEAISKRTSIRITSFNGGYVGYITPFEHYYTAKSGEVREMNWTGPYTGEMLQEIIWKAIPPQ